LYNLLLIKGVVNDTLLNSLKEKKFDVSTTIYETEGKAFRYSYIPTNSMGFIIEFLI
jgi:hypothetical protein